MTGVGATGARDTVISVAEAECRRAADAAEAAYQDAFDQTVTPDAGNLLKLCLAAQFERAHRMQGVAEAECRRAADAAEAAYQEAFDQAVTPDESSLDREHARCMAAAHQQYASSAVGEPCSATALDKLLSHGCSVTLLSSSSHTCHSCAGSLGHKELQLCRAAPRVGQLILGCQAAHRQLCHAGEESIKAANQQRYEQRLQQGYKAFRQERLASAEVACRRLISDFTARVTQACLLCNPAILGSIPCLLAAKRNRIPGCLGPHSAAVQQPCA